MEKTAIDAETKTSLKTGPKRPVLRLVAKTKAQCSRAVNAVKSVPQRNRHRVYAAKFTP